MRRIVFLAALLVAAPARAQGVFTLTSPDLEPNATVGARHVLDGYGCTGQNVSPALRWSGAPAGTKSFAVTVHDPDAPTGHGWWHWVLYDVPATVTALAAGAKGVGAEGNTDFGDKGYGGPCPPRGDEPHRYVFTVFALKAERVGVPASASAATVDSVLQANRLATATLTARYGR